jgi:hypothetical protein
VLTAYPEWPSSFFRKNSETNSFLTAVLSFQSDAAIANNNKPSLIPRKQPSSSFWTEEVTDQTPLIFQWK